MQNFPFKFLALLSHIEKMKVLLKKICQNKKKLTCNITCLLSPPRAKGGGGGGGNIKSFLVDIKIV